MVSAPAQAPMTAAVHARSAADPHALFDAAAVGEMTAAVHAPSAAEPQAVFDAAAAAAVGRVVAEICGRVFPE